MNKSNLCLNTNEFFIRLDYRLSVQLINIGYFSRGILVKNIDVDFTEALSSIVSGNRVLSSYQVHHKKYMTHRARRFFEWSVFLNAVKLRWVEICGRVMAVKRVEVCKLWNTGLFEADVCSLEFSFTTRVEYNL